jgi:hypothetical protein
MIVFKKIWSVIPCNLGDHFRRFGGTARQYGAENSDLQSHRCDNFKSRCQDFRVRSPDLLYSWTEICSAHSLHVHIPSHYRQSPLCRSVSSWRRFVKRNAVMRIAISHTCNVIIVGYVPKSIEYGKTPRRTAGKRFYL